MYQPISLLYATQLIACLLSFKAKAAFILYGCFVLPVLIWEGTFYFYFFEEIFGKVLYMHRMSFVYLKHSYIEKVDHSFAQLHTVLHLYQDLNLLILL